MSKQEKYETNIYIVDSVKGGCGKSSLAIWKAIDIAFNNSEKSVCYIDLDLLGTSIENMLELQQKQQYYYLNDLFSGDRMAVQKKRVKRDFDLDGLQIDPVTQKPSLYQFVYNADRTPPSEKYVSIGMVFSSPEQKEKNKFRVGHSTDGHHIDFDFFARRLNELFNELIDGGVTDFVIDMPPNSDPYTDSIFGQFLKREIKRRKIGVHLLLISSLDRAHLEANRQWLIDLCSKSAQWYEFTSVAYYFNDIRNNLKNKRSDEKVNDVKLLAGKIVRDMKDVCNCKEQQSYLVEHNIYLSGYAIWQGGNPDQEPPSDSTFPSISTIPVNFEE